MLHDTYHLSNDELTDVVTHEEAFVTSKYMETVEQFAPSSVFLFKHGPRHKERFLSKRFGVEGRVIAINDSLVSVPVYFFMLESDRSKIYGNIWPDFAAVTGEFNTVPDAETIIPLPRINLCLDTIDGLRYAHGNFNESGRIGMQISNFAFKLERIHPENFYVPALKNTYRGILIKEN